jgi:hypothetical protein
MKTLPVTAVEYQSLKRENPRSRVVVTALLSVLLIATIISFGGQYNPSGQQHVRCQHQNDARVAAAA